MNTITSGVTTLQPSQVEGIIRTQNDFSIISGSVEQQSSAISPKRNSMQVEATLRDVSSRLDSRLGLVMSQSA